jgi:hypothetical protein
MNCCVTDTVLTVSANYESLLYIGFCTKMPRYSKAAMIGI